MPATIVIELGSLNAYSPSARDGQKKAQNKFYSSPKWKGGKVGITLPERRTA